MLPFRSVFGVEPGHPVFRRQGVEHFLEGQEADDVGVGLGLIPAQLLHVVTTKLASGSDAVRGELGVLHLVHETCLHRVEESL